MAITVTYSESAEGWPSFYSYLPEYMIGMNSYFYSFKGGNLWRHNTNSLRNNFYGTQATEGSTITTVFNMKPLEAKVWKTLTLESDAAWKATVTTDLSTNNSGTQKFSGTIQSSYFKEKEGDWFAFIRSNSTDPQNFNLRSASGIGQVTTVNGFVTTAVTLTFAFDFGGLISVGDTVFAGNTPTIVGPITAVSGKVITVDASGASSVVPNNGDYILYLKNPVAESHGMLGYSMEVKLENTSTSPVELFAVGSSIFKSYP